MAPPALRLLPRLLLQALRLETQQAPQWLPLPPQQLPMSSLAGPAARGGAGSPLAPQLAALGTPQKLSRLLLLLVPHQETLLAQRRPLLALLVTTRLEALVALQRLLLRLLMRTIRLGALLALRHPSWLLLLALQLATRASSSMASPACNQSAVTSCGTACACQPGHRWASLEVRRRPGYAAPSLRTHWEHPAPSLPWWRRLQLSPGGRS